MPFIKKIHDDFEINQDHIVLTKKYLNDNKTKFKKITGSRFSNVLNMNKYTTPFKTWCIMTNLFQDKMDPTLAKVGNAIEPKVRAYVESVTKTKYLEYNPFTVKWDVFKDNSVFGGIPDGEPLDEKGNIDLNKPMLEIKTTSIDRILYKTINNSLEMQKNANGYPLVKAPKEKYNSWFANGKIIIPDEYLMQLGLYMYLRGIKNGIFAIAFLETSDYVEYENYDVSNREVRLVKVQMNNDIKRFTDQARNWYESHITTGKSPKMTHEDIMWLKKEGISFNNEKENNY